MSWKSIRGYFTFGHFGSVIVSQWRYAFSRNSSSHSGSFFLREMSRITSSDRPFGVVSESISVTKPCSYGLSIRFWRTALIGQAASSVALTLKLSPQPQVSSTFGFLTVNSCLKPSRTKSSSDPSR